MRRWTKANNINTVCKSYKIFYFNFLLSSMMFKFLYSRADSQLSGEAMTTRRTITFLKCQYSVVNSTHFQITSHFIWLVTWLQFNFNLSLFNHGSLLVYLYSSNFILDSGFILCIMIWTSHQDPTICSYIQGVFKSCIAIEFPDFVTVSLN